MKILSFHTFFWLVGLIVPLAINAQDTNSTTQEVSLQVAGSALLSIYGPPVVLKLAGASEAGDSISTNAENNLTRLRISSLVNNEELRNITAKLSDALVGTQLSVELKSPNSNFVFPQFKGNLMGAKVLSNESDSKLVEGIGTCWSGKGEDDGYVIEYKFGVIPGASILKSTDISITYTISTVPSDGSSGN